MFDSRKIDSYFEENHPQRRLETDNTPPQSKWLRFIKLFAPCFAALLVGLMVVIPNIKKSVDLNSDVTIPRKNEIEKLHIEDTVFNSVDNKNRVNTVWADSVDEVEPGSQKVKIINPRGYVPLDNGEININSQNGYFTRDTTVLELEDNVSAVINGKTTVTTQKATYDFKKEYGFGDMPVNAVGDWGTLQAKAFTFNKKRNQLNLKGYNQITTDKGILTAEKETRIYRNDNKSVSYGNATIQQAESSMRADKIIAYFSDKGKKQIKKLEAYGKAVITMEDKTLLADKVEVLFTLNAKNEIKTAYAYGNVQVITTKGTAHGKRGVYSPQAQKVDLYDDVVLEQNGNFIKGTHAQTDLSTSVSRITANEKNGGRISGIFYKRKK